MKLLLFPSFIAATLYAVQHWEWAFYLTAWAFATGVIYTLYRSAYHYLFDP